MTKKIAISIEEKLQPGSDSTSFSLQKDLVRPIEFSPAGGFVYRKFQRVKPVTLLLGISLIIVVLAASFVFSARSLVIQTTPAHSDVQIRGGLTIPLGSRYLLLEGKYDIYINAPGYYPHTQELSVSEKQNQRVEFLLEKTPGLLKISTVPSDNVQILVNNQEQTLTPTGILELAAGEHTIVLNADRYLSREITLDIDGKGKEQRLNVNLKPAWAQINFSSVPSQASVILDNNSIGVTPLVYDVLQGDHAVRFELEGYESFSEDLVVTAGESYHFDSVKLDKIGAWLHLTTLPNQANVTFDNEFKGQTPLKLSVRPGVEHRLAVFKAGYQRVSREVELMSGEKKTLALKLKPQLASVDIRITPVGAQLYIDGKFIGSGSQTLQLPAYRQVVEVRKPGYQTEHRPLTPRPGFEQSIAVRLMTEHQARWAKVKSRLTTSAGQQLLLFHPSKFEMGASRREAGRRSNEILRSVHMKRAFYLANKEVTNAQFRLFKNDHSSGHVEGNSLDGDQQPVVKVTWEQAATYCNWLSKQDSLTPFYQIEKNSELKVNFNANGYRLPTEAEWAWAARTLKGKPQLKFPWGSSLPPPANSGNYADNDSAPITGRAIAGYQDGFIVSAPVGSYAANQQALFDMGGNVSEWVNDYYGLHSQQAKQVISDPTGPNSGEYRVIRGSSWAHGTVTELRFSYRDYGREVRDDLGFRIARYVE